MLVAILFMLSLIFLIKGKIHTVIIDKEKNHIIISQKSVLCKENAESYSLDDISTFKAVPINPRAGTCDSKSCHAVAEFTNLPALEILKSKRFAKIQMQVTIINEFVSKQTTDPATPNTADDGTRF